MGTAVAQCYKSEGHWLDPSWCHWNFSIDIKSFRSHYGPGIDSASNRNEYQERFLGGKDGRYVRLTTLPPSCAVVMKSGNLHFLESSGPLQAGNGTALPIYRHYIGKKMYERCENSFLHLRSNLVRLQRDLDWITCPVQAYLHPKHRRDSSPEYSNLAADSLVLMAFYSYKFKLQSGYSGEHGSRNSGLLPIQGRHSEHKF